MLRCVSGLAMSSLALYYATDESREGRNAFIERRPPDFSRFRGKAPAT
jgi:1,4-dihydroxy-2-naphthoyl-CoA synthase